MKVKILVIVSVSLLAALAIYGLVITGCGTGPTTDKVTTHSYFGTQSPGDAWSWEINDDLTFWASNETDGFWISGSYTILPNSFLKGSVEASSNPAAEGGTVYALVLQNELLLIAPPLDENLIVCAGKSESPPSAGVFPWIAVPKSGWYPIMDETYGLITIESIGDSYTLKTVAYNLLDSQIGSQIIDSGFTFVDGRLIQSGSSKEVSISPSGIFVCDKGGDFGGYAGSIKPAADVRTLAASHEYKGFFFKYDPSAGTGLLQPVKVEPYPGQSTWLRGFVYSDIDSDTVDVTKIITVELTSYNSERSIVMGIIKDTASVIWGRAKLIIPEINNKYLILGVRAATIEAYPYNFVAIQTD